MKERILEIQFFFFCRKYLYYKNNKNLNSLINFLEALRWTNTFDCDILCNVILDMFVNKNNIPTILEYCTIYDLNPTTIRESTARKHFNMDRKTFRKHLTLARIKNLDARSIYPRYPKEVHKAIKDFKNTLRNLLTWESIINDD